MKFSGTVKRHVGRGTKLGFPTANINAPSNVEEGIFVARVLVCKEQYPALVFIGVPRTFDDGERRAEAHILNFKGNLYGQKMEVELLKKIRENQKFEEESKLVEQIKKDIQGAREYFDENVLE